MNNKSFDTKRIAEGYTKRPWLHKQVIEQMKFDYPDKIAFKNGLDVGCGAGLSTKALKIIAKKVTGTDISETMITICKKNYQENTYHFYVAKAEETIIPEERYDIVTAAGVFNWIDKNAFFKNIDHILEQDGMVLIYDFWITDKMSDQRRYTQWYKFEYLKKFPKPQRNEEGIEKEIVDGFVLLQQKKYEMTVAFCLEDFINFMMIQSNVNECIENGNKTMEEVYEWMLKTLSPIFEGEKRNLIFEGYSWYIKRE